MKEQEKIRLFAECKTLVEMTRLSNAWKIVEEAIKKIDQLEKLNLMDEFNEWYEGGMKQWTN